jgi:HlyD family secretion protein
VGANPEHKIDNPARDPDPVAWIGRDHAAFERIGTHAPPVPVFGGPGSRAKWMLGAAAVVVVVGIATAIWMSRASAPPGVATTLANQESIPLVTVLMPGVSPVATSVTFTGAIAARFDMPIGIDGDAGRIVGVYVEAGDHVKRGQLLARLDDSVLVPQVNRLAASLEQARAQAALSAAEYRRARGVEAAGALSAEEIERRHATATTDEAAVKVVAAQLAEYQARLNRTRVVAPVAGTVLTRRAEVGQIASSGGEALFRIASGGEVEMRGQIAEQDLAVLKIGQPASIYLTGLAHPFAGRVRLLSAVIDPQTRLGEIRIALNPDPSLRPGAFARGAVTVDNAERPVLPQTAVMSDSKGTYVFVVNAQNRVERRPVRVAGTIDAGVIVAEGLTGTERVVTTAGGFLREGETVTIAPPPAPAEKAAQS